MSGCAGAGRPAAVLLQHEEQVGVPLQQGGVELLGGLDGLAHPPRQHQLLDLCPATSSALLAPFSAPHVKIMRKKDSLCRFLMEASSSCTAWSVDLAKASAVAQ